MSAILEPDMELAVLLSLVGPSVRPDVRGLVRLLPSESRSALGFLTAATCSNFSDSPSLLIVTFEFSKSQEEKWLL